MFTSAVRKKLRDIRIVKLKDADKYDYYRGLMIYSADEFISKLNVEWPGSDQQPTNAYKIG